MEANVDPYNLDLHNLVGYLEKHELVDILLQKAQSRTSNDSKVSQYWKKNKEMIQQIRSWMSPKETKYTMLNLFQISWWWLLVEKQRRKAPRARTNKTPIMSAQQCMYTIAGTMQTKMVATGNFCACCLPKWNLPESFKNESSAETCRTETSNC